MTRRQAYQVCGQPCTSSSGGPWPPVTTCWRSPPASMYWLVNVLVNPSGRFGAPETEPGPSGTGSPLDDELMRVPLPQDLTGFRGRKPEVAAVGRFAGPTGWPSHAPNAMDNPAHGHPPCRFR